MREYDLLVIVRGSNSLPAIADYFHDYHVEYVPPCSCFLDVFKKSLDLFLDHGYNYCIMIDEDVRPAISDVSAFISAHLAPFAVDTVLTVNSNRIDRFWESPIPLDGGAKAYSRKGAEIYRKNLNDSYFRPESNLYTKVGGLYQLKTIKPLSLHEFSCLPISIYKKAYLRTIKMSNTKTTRRYLNLLEDLIYDQAIKDASTELLSTNLDISCSTQLSYDNVQLPSWISRLPDIPLMSESDLTAIASSLQLPSFRSLPPFLKSLIAYRFDKRKNKRYKSLIC